MNERDWIRQLPAGASVEAGGNVAERVLADLPAAVVADRAAPAGLQRGALLGLLGAAAIGALALWECLQAAHELGWTAWMGNWTWGMP